MVKACNKVSYGKLGIQGFESLHLHYNAKAMETQEKQERSVDDFPGDNMIEE